MTEIEKAVPVLPRELTSITADVAAVSAPPTPIVSDPYHFRLADADADAEMLSEWMNRPHLAKAWEYDNPTSWWRGYLRAQLAGEYSRPFVGALEGEDVAYIEVYRAAKDSIAPRYAADPHDLGIHAAIADLRFLNQGYAPLLLPVVVASLFELDPQCRRIMFDPDHRNKGARAVCELAQCAFLGEHDMANRRMALYALPRTPTDVPQPL